MQLLLWIIGVAFVAGTYSGGFYSKWFFSVSQLWAWNYSDFGKLVVNQTFEKMKYPVQNQAWRNCSNLRTENSRSLFACKEKKMWEVLQNCQDQGTLKN